MPEHEHKPATPEAPKYPSVVRKDSEGNDVSVTMGVKEFGKVSPNKGTKYYAPIVTEETLPHIIKWASPKWISSVVGAKLASVFGGIFIDNIDKEGPNAGKLNLEAWMADAIEFSEGVDSLESLKAEKSVLQDKMTELTDSPEFLIEEGVEPTPRLLEITKELDTINAQIKQLNKEINKLSIKNAKKSALRAATKAKNEAAAKLANEKSMADKKAELEAANA